MNIPSLDQWSSLPAGTYALLTLHGNPQRLSVVKVQEEVAVLVGSTRLCGPEAWAALLPQINTVELGYTPVDSPEPVTAPTLTMGELTSVLEKFPSACILQIRVNGELAAPGKPWLHLDKDREVTVNLVDKRLTVAEFLEQLNEYRIMVPRSPGLPVRIRNRYRRVKGYRSVTGAHQVTDTVYLDVE